MEEIANHASRISKFHSRITKNESKVFVLIICSYALNSVMRSYDYKTFSKILRRPSRKALYLVVADVVQDVIIITIQRSHLKFLVLTDLLEDSSLKIT